MRRHDRLSVPDPSEQPDAYQDPDVLKNLYVERGWRRKDIVRHFDITDHEVVKYLEKHGIERDVKGSQAPTNGLAAKLFEKGKQEAVQS